MASVASRQTLTRWATEVTGTSVGKATAMEKQLSNGAIYCQLMESVRPGSIHLGKVNKEADAEHKSLPNYKLLGAALDKAGVEFPLDMPQLTKGQPAAHLELLQKIYALAPQGMTTEGCPAAKGLRPLDANLLDDSAGGRGGKRRAAAPAPAPAASRSVKRPAEGAASAIEEDEEVTPAADDVAGIAEAELRAQLEQCQAELLVSRAEALDLRDEADFYIAKLELIEDACLQKAPAEVPAAVLELLRADEEQVEQGSA